MDLRTGHRYWAICNGLLATYPPLDRDETADIAIVGAGITGALAAYELTRAGLNVVVLDKQDAGMGSSAASTGLLLYEIDTSMEDLATRFGEPAAARAYRLGLDAIDHIERTVARLGDDCGFARRPSLYLASREEDAAALAREHALRRKHRIPVELLRRTDVEARYGISAPAALYSQGCGELDTFRFTHRLLAAAQAGGARVYDRTEVEHVRRDREGVLLHTNRAHHVRAGRLLCATGYEAARTLRRRTGDLVSTWAFASEPVPDLSMWPDRCLIWETARPYLYLRTTKEGRVLVGGEDESFSKAHQSQRLMERKAHRLRERAHALFPGLDLEVAFGWAGVFGGTQDGLPFIGGLEDYPHTWFALGYGGNGITFSVTAALILRDAALGRTNPDAALFGFDRPTARRRRWWWSR